MIQCSHEKEIRKPDTVLVQKENIQRWMKNIVYPDDNKVYHEKERKFEKYERLVLKYSKF